MRIPDFTDLGLLPTGVHTCTIEEAQRRFGPFQASDRRPKLFQSLLSLLGEMQRTGLFVAVVLDGSFVTATATPNDIDLLLVVPRSHDWNRDPALHEYNVLSHRRFRRRFGFDAFVVTDGDADYDE